MNQNQPNPALNLAPFGRWTLRDKAAQRRLALRWASRLYTGSTRTPLRYNISAYEGEQ